MKRKSIYLLLILVLSQTAVWARSCTSSEYDKAEYYSDRAAKKIVGKYGGGDDIRMELRACSYNSYSEEFKTTINIYWNGLIFGSNHYNVDGILKFSNDGTLKNFSKTYQNSAVDDLDFFGDVITFAAVVASEGQNNISVENRCTQSIEIKIHYMDTNSEWKTKGWWTFEAGERSSLASGGTRLHTNNAIVYYYAQYTSSGNRINQYDKKIDGYKMQKLVDKHGTTEIVLCR